MKGSQILFAAIAIHQAHSSTNLRHGASDQGPLALNSDRFGQGPSNHGSLQQVRQGQDAHNLQEFLRAGNTNHHRNLQQCDFCGSQGSCGRTTPLGEFYSVTVQDSEPVSSWLVSCLHPNRNAPDCYYSPNGDANIISIPKDADFQQAIFSCPNECCTWAYPRSKWANLPVTDTTSCDGETNCREISQICHLSTTATKTFSCPVGTLMYVEGGTGSTTLTVGEGAQVVSVSQSCNQVSNGIECPYSRLAFSMAAVISADDCNCITCDGSGTVQEGTCSTPIPSYLPSEGKCLTTTTIDICLENLGNLANDTGLSFSLTARDDSNTTGWLPSDRNDVNGTASVMTPGNSPAVNVTEEKIDDIDSNITGISNETIDDTWDEVMDNITTTNETVADEWDELLDNSTATNETGTDPPVATNAPVQATDNPAATEPPVATDNSTSTLSDAARAERDTMVLHANGTKTAMEALQTSMEQGTLTTMEKLALLQIMKDSLTALKTAIQSAVAFQPKNASYCLGVIASIQSQMTMFSCGITNGCISSVDMVQVLIADTALIVDIIHHQLLME